MSQLTTPLLFEPFLRPMPWGGHKLGNWLGRSLPPEQAIGEAWLLSDHGLHASIVKEGPRAGQTLRQLIERHATDLIGRVVDRFPVLVKLLDAQENLSVQVHPDDELARQWAVTEGGKSEAWLVLEADPDARIYLGLKPGMDRSFLAREAAHGTLPLCLKQYEPRPGECYNVPAGAIHAIGGGVVLLEVQQTSDATFRLFDWHRVDDTGKPRELHLGAGLACLKERPPGVGLQAPRSDVLVDTPFFCMRRWELSQEKRVVGPVILVGLDGMGRVTAGGQSLPLLKGHAILVPAAAASAVIRPEPRCVVVQITIPG